MFKRFALLVSLIAVSCATTQKSTEAYDSYLIVEIIEDGVYSIAGSIVSEDEISNVLASIVDATGKRSILIGVETKTSVYDIAIFARAAHPLNIKTYFRNSSKKIQEVVFE